MRFFLTLLLCMFADSCSPGYEKIEREEMLDIVSDLMIIEHVVRNYDIKRQDSIRVLMKENLLKVHNISEHQLDTNLYLYQFDSESYREFTKELVEVLTAKREALNPDESKENNTDE